MRKENREEYVIVLDYLPHGYPFDDTPGYKKTPIIQCLGEMHLTLLEAVPKKKAIIKTRDKIYIGEGKRERVHHINGRLSPDKLTTSAKAELDYVLTKFVTEKEEKYVEFFNKAPPLTTRMHTLELLPGLGKKHMWEIIEQRRDEKFKSFEDIKKRVKLLPDPKKIVVKRIKSELLGKEKYNLFVRK
ncbi:DUF655 domain-containing protein [Candidatus Woesearchaeota archaeon]|nr:DUF655 domain-containing protein [Candidatus Woesearchaeota archaeon]